MVYLLKVTFAWTLFLLLFEIFFKNNGRFTANRFYLLVSIAAGLLIPLIPVHVPVPVAFSDAVTAAQVSYPAIRDVIPELTTTTMPATASAVATKQVDGWLLLPYLYGIGVVCLTLRLLWESVRITRLLLHGPCRIVAGHKVIVTGRNHAPYSFMDRIFIGDPDAYPAEELTYIIRHEAAHNLKKHGVDLLLLQITCIVCWFHPLIWRYRHLMQLQHEYEADALAGGEDPYAYGHFLLQQTLLGGVPSLAHSFHFSPIKNRIIMLTQRKNQKPGAWKYLLALPALLGCTLLIAKTTDKTDNVRQDNISTYKGNTFMWREAVVPPVNEEKKDTKTAQTDEPNKKQFIYEMNGEPVYQNESVNTAARYGNSEFAYADYVRNEFTALTKTTEDSLTIVDLSNVVVNKAGKIVYYEVRYSKPATRMLQKQKQLYGNWELAPEGSPVPNSTIDKIIAEGPTWKPAMVNGQTVNSFVTIRKAGC